MITKVEIRNPAGALLTLELDDISDGIVLQEISGLDPVKATIVSSSFANADGSQYHSSRRENRNILLTLGLEPDYVTTTVQDLRNLLYEYLMPRQEVNLRFYNSSGLIVNISGRVETFESALFVREPVVEISIICFDPDFVELESIELEGNTTSTTSETSINYDGTVETGIEFVLNLDRTLTEFTIYHTPPDGTTRLFDFAAEMIADDVLKINTNVGSKGATLTRATTTSSVLYGVSPQANWIELARGTNMIRVYAEGDEIPYTITYTNRYGGL